MRDCGEISTGNWPDDPEFRRLTTAAGYDDKIASPMLKLSVITGFLACLAACGTSSPASQPLSAVTSDANFSSSQPSLSPQPSLSTRMSIPGSRWLVVNVARGNERAQIPPSLKAEIGFSTSGKISGSDTFNPFYGEYTLSDAGFTTSDMGAGLKGSIGMGKEQALIVNVIDSMFLGLPNDKTSTGTDVRAQFHGSRLVLEAGNYRTTLRPA